MSKATLPAADKADPQKTKAANNSAAPKDEKPAQEQDNSKPPEDPRVAARRRAHECGEVVADVLGRFNCEIRAVFNPIKSVGDGGDEIQVSCRWGVMPKL